MLPWRSTSRLGFSNGVPGLQQMAFLTTLVRTNYTLYLKPDFWQGQSCSLEESSA